MVITKLEVDTAFIAMPVSTHNFVTKSHDTGINNFSKTSPAENVLLPNGRHTHPCGLGLLLLFSFPFVTTTGTPHPILYTLSLLAEKLTFDHANVVSPISYGQSDGLLVFLDELHHLSFLQRGDPAADHRFTRARCRHKFHLHVCFQCMCLTQERSEGKRSRL